MANLEQPRIRFNWGYHDGANESKRDKTRDVTGHFDSWYATGYKLGVSDATALAYEGNSDAAWEAFTTADQLDDRAYGENWAADRALTHRDV